MATATEDPLAPATDTEDEETPLKPNAEKGALFDKAQYDSEELSLPQVDGQGIDKIRVKLSGSVMLDRAAPADVALFRKLLLGHEVELRVAGKVSKVGTGFTTNREGDLDAVVGERTIDVGTVWVMSPEELA